jgi:hypothetical protein
LYFIVFAKYNIIKKKNIYNIDKSEIQIKYKKLKKVIIFINIKKIYTSSLENCKFIIIIKAISADITVLDLILQI